MADFGFDQFDMFSMFGMDTPSEEPKEEVKEEVKVSEPVKDEEPVLTATTDPAADDEDMDDDSASEDSSEETTKTTATTKKTTTKSKTTTVKGDSKVKLPITVYGRNFIKKIEELADATWNGVLSYLFNEGIKEVATDITLIPFEGGAYISPSSTKTSEDTMAQFPENGEIVVADGLLQAPLTQAVIGKDADEISVEDLFDKFVEINPAYAEYKGLNYNIRTGVATPVAPSTKVEKVTLPAKVSVCGQVVELTLDDFPSSTEITADKAFYNQIPISEVRALKFEFVKIGDIYVVVGSQAKGGSGVVLLNKDFAEVLKDAKTKTVEEKYTLPFLLVATSSDQRVNVTSDMFDGKEKVKQDDVLKFLSKNNSSYDPQLIGFKIYSASDRQFNFVYSDNADARKLVVSATSGKKG